LELKVGSRQETCLQLMVTLFSTSPTRFPRGLPESQPLFRTPPLTTSVCNVFRIGLVSGSLIAPFLVSSAVTLMAVARRSITRFELAGTR
jgi:hypothetical protein